jgi:acyl-coenzyme A thioesterase PaaI-like protein
VHADGGAGPRSCVTLSLTVNFVGAVSEGRLTIDARRTGGGKTIFFAEGNVRDAAGNLIATATGSFRYITRK